VSVSVRTSHYKARASIMEMEITSRKTRVCVILTHHRVDWDSRDEI